jgi:hypothetical protein
MRFRPRHKYHAIPIVLDGVRYASKAEAEWVSYRLFLLRVGQFAAVRRQPQYQLGDIRYRADDEVTDLDGHVFAEDVKGVETPRFRLVRRLWPKYGPCPLRVVKCRGRKWSIELIPGKKEPAYA